jgi:dihydroxy-acid dehydratase
MTAPAHLLKLDLPYALPCIGDGRQSGTSASPSILNASPEAAENGNLAILKDGDVLRVDLNKRRVDLLVSEEEIASRRKALMDGGGYKSAKSQTPWQELFRGQVGPLSGGMVFEEAVKYRGVGGDEFIPRDNH